ncbi:DISARM system SNF2-like helicase DrmD [Thermomonospora curvata]|uniref:Helicase domain protein n=1 Tax=Thermomonospora curvata (strain ATCC 19995 / DSM 43183 / JCM 3096 / KCTC 9072 / NBRC 15933 / NCIMB 10081 / Henssen B9) TaxID=471852 RepID=D1A4T7_THECD|nr:DISARM system SNF2-like helicase DrmD [Thermomonospora curvata]ACY98106.1 helicase domain protein [Thermomonospora curvata DSM 43183]
MAPTVTAEPPAPGALVQVRGRRWVVSTVDERAGNTLVTLQSVEDGRYGDTLSVIWEIEPGRRLLPSGSLPEVRAGRFDPPERLAAFLDAVRWGAVASADVKTLQAPFRSGVAIEDYQLEPVARAMDAPRVNLLLADDVGLGKTIEAGLVAQELLLRQRARKIMIVCPAGLTVKWRDEMAEKFGLEFTVIDSARCAEVRRTHGSAANPFEVYPLSIVSLPWLRGPKAQRLLEEVLPPDGPTYPRTFDLLILDEAHHVAPAAPKQVYAVDSQQTKLIRRLAPHFTHRLFLSATPHNGYQASFTALLEILDDQRFARGVEPDQAAVRETVVRRLKHQVVNADGTPRFKARKAEAIPVRYPEDEREIHALLQRFAQLRRRRLNQTRGRRAADLVTLLLKKRLFSSPAAFARTVDVYMQTLKNKSAPSLPPEDDWLLDFFEETATLDDEALEEAEADALARTTPLIHSEEGTQDEELALLEKMHKWAAAHEARPDAKAKELINYLISVCRPGKDWTNERVIVFTEYRDTKDWLHGLLRDHGLGGERLAELDGTMTAQDREKLRLAFQKSPAEHPVRILLATDAASEGIDLQNHCHRLVNYDIPFNPNKLEQRIGRIDRYGQKHTPEIRHFVGTGWDKAVDSYEADLEFLSRVAKKVAQMEEDLGQVNAVLADAVQRRLLGEQVDVDAETARAAAREKVPTEGDVSGQVRRLRETVEETVKTLHITPEGIKRVVDTALELARQRPLTKAVDPDPVYEVPVLTGSWERATAGLLEKLPTGGGEPRRLPVTFDQEVARRRDDVVLAHLGHPLVAMSTRLLRAAVSNDQLDLARVTAVVSDDPELETTLLAAYSRFVLVGADGVRLHEEVLHAGGWAPEGGRFRRWESVQRLGDLLDRALTHGTPATPRIQARLAERFEALRPGLEAAIRWRAETRRESLERRLLQRRDAESRRIVANIDQFAETLRRKLAKGDESEALFSEIEVRARSKEELRQYQMDRKSWEERLQRLAAEKDQELRQIQARYADPRPHSFPVAVIFVVPKREAN